MKLSRIFLSSCLLLSACATVRQMTPTILEDGDRVYYADSDGDDHGNKDELLVAGTRPAGYVTSTDDCKDDDKTMYPGASEVCDGKDNNCNGTVDEGVTKTFYRDADKDGHGTETSTSQACAAPSSYVDNDGDCKDDDKTMYPGASETCDGKDNNCNGMIDEGVTKTFYRDTDKDGFGTATNAVEACAQPAGFTAKPGDCDDAKTAIHAGVAETCNGLDDDCDSLVDEGVKTTFYQDSDDDDYGSNLVRKSACSQPRGFITRGGDCNDSEKAVHPGAAETSNSLDDDCDLLVDEALPKKGASAP